MASQELEWHAIDDVEFEANVEDIDQLFAMVTNTDTILEYE